MRIRAGRKIELQSFYSALFPPCRFVDFDFCHDILNRSLLIRSQIVVNRDFERQRSTISVKHRQISGSEWFETFFREVTRNDSTGSLPGFHIEFLCSRHLGSPFLIADFVFPDHAMDESIECHKACQK